MLINLRTGDLSLLLGLPENMTPTGTCGECMEALIPKHLYSPDVCCSLSHTSLEIALSFPKQAMMLILVCMSGGKDQGKGPMGCPS